MNGLAISIGITCTGGSGTGMVGDFVLSELGDYLLLENGLDFIVIE
jgi:hypothetical protein